MSYHLLLQTHKYIVREAVISRLKNRPARLPLRGRPGLDAA